MRKIIVTILSLVYLFASAGVTVRAHYCMGQLADWGMGQISSGSCNTCGMEESKSKKGCCHDEHTFIKNATDQVADGTVSPVKQIVFAGGPVYFPEIISADLSSFETGTISQKSPPGDGIAIYLHNCVFRI